MFKGMYTAIVTPFRNGEIDWDAYKNLVEDQIKAGVDGIVPCGTTGESATLTHQEHIDMIKASVEYAGGKIKVIAGTGSNSTREAIELTKAAEKAGADGALLITPYYNKPTQRGLYYHFKAIAEETELPLILYNIPGRTAVKLEIDTICKLAELKNIVGIKEATGSLDMATSLVLNCPEDFVILSGDDTLTLPIMAVGGHGVISAVANIVPEDMVKLVRAMENNDIATARSLHQKLFPLIKAIFIETNPIPVKQALALMDKVKMEYRLPLVEMTSDHKVELMKVMRNYGLID